MKYGLLVTFVALFACNGGDETDTNVVDSDTDADTDSDTDSDTDTDTDTDTDVVDTDTGVPVDPYATGLVYHFRFDGDVVDSGPSNFAFVSGTPAYTTDRHGVAGKAGAAGACLRVGPYTNNGATGAMSWAAWVRPNSTFSSQWRNTAAGHGGGAYQTYWSSSQWTTEVYSGTPTRAPYFLSTSLTLAQDVWTHITFVYDTVNGAAYYVDGVAVATTGTGPDNIQSGAGDELIGCGGDAQFAGDYDEVSLWDRRLTADEAAALAAE